MRKWELENELCIKKLKLKLIKAKDRLEGARASEEEAKLMLPSFSVTFREVGERKGGGEERGGTTDKQH